MAGRGTAAQGARARGGGKFGFFGKEDVEMYVTFDDTTLTMTEIVGSTTINIVFKA